MNVCFAKGQWQKQDMIQAYSFRFTETPNLVQEEDAIASGVNPQHREGYDNVSLLNPAKNTFGVKAQMNCAFEGLGCSEIIIVEHPETCSDGAVRYGVFSLKCK